MPDGRSQVIHDTVTVSLSTLAAGGVVLGAIKIDASQQNGFRVKKVRAAVSYEQKDTVKGPIVVGFAASSLTLTEVKECLDADPQGPDDIPAADQANRKVWPVWMMPAATELDNRNIREMVEIYWPYKEVAENVPFQAWAQNIDGSAVSALIVIQMAFYGIWLRD